MGHIIQDAQLSQRDRAAGCVIVILSRTVSELWQLIVQILDTLRFQATLWGLRDNVRCSSWAH